MRLGIKLSILIILYSIPYSCEAQDIDNLMTNRDKREMVRLINQARQKGVRCGGEWQKPVPALKWDNQLEEASVDKSFDMYQKKYFDHTSPSGENLADRIKKVDYSWMTIGENLAQGPVEVKQAVDTWLKSEGHCKNIMKPQFTHFGAAQYGTYWTQVFAKPKE